MSDVEAQLYQRMKLGDKKALEAIYDRYAKLLFSFTYKMTGQSELSEEIVQEVFIKLWAGKGHYDEGKGKFSSWLLTVTRNTCIDQLRKRKESAVLENQDTIPSDNPSVEDLAEWRENGSILRKAISELGEEQQKMVELFYFKGLSQQKIADSCNLPLGTVKGRIRLALAHLKKHLHAFGYKGGEYLGKKEL
ncbi:RNA polymerase sigma-70 factor, ECF subfamily [Bacillus sp. OV322]|uniref:RNA polymerase sigma factor n=1 Tax=Bacillus sp. OV322 TaxID=1882764 RepID=UPI0008ED4226|nr:sigma-70 family RNA polymerase sigma factor [Bacillus sp. OV322]SFC01429.1 RNA polymerase sigma-70 factor, ECF subfamily [Bacillus sp. OV322]